MRPWRSHRDSLTARQPLQSQWSPSRLRCLHPPHCPPGYNSDLRWLVTSDSRVLGASLSQYGLCRAGLIYRCCLGLVDYSLGAEKDAHQRHAAPTPGLGCEDRLQVVQVLHKRWPKQQKSPNSCQCTVYVANKKATWDCMQCVQG